VKFFTISIQKRSINDGSYREIQATAKKGLAAKPKKGRRRAAKLAGWRRKFKNQLVTTCVIQCGVKVLLSDLVQKTLEKRVV